MSKKTYENMGECLNETTQSSALRLIYLTLLNDGSIIYDKIVCNLCRCIISRLAVELLQKFCRCQKTLSLFAGELTESITTAFVFYC